MEVKLLKDFGKIPCGSVININTVGKNTYTGIWSSMFGTFTVEVDKNYCEIIKK